MSIRRVEIVLKFNPDIKRIVKARPISDKRSSTGNLCYFTDQFDNHPWENPELNHTLRNTVSDHFFSKFSILFQFQICALTIVVLVCKKSNGDGLGPSEKKQ